MNLFSIFRGCARIIGRSVLPVREGQIEFDVDEGKNKGQHIVLKYKVISKPNFPGFKQYYCPCGEPLEEGPEGGGSVNAVCNKCRINYGCLPGFY